MGKLLLNMEGMDEEKKHTEQVQMRNLLESIREEYENFFLEDSERPDLFPVWHSSLVANLYVPPVFINKTKSGGYWFYKNPPYIHM